MKDIMKKLDYYFNTTSKEQLIDDDTNGDNILTNWEIYKLYEEVKKLTGTKLRALDYIDNYFKENENGEYYMTHNFDKDNLKELKDIIKGLRENQKTALKLLDENVELKQRIQKAIEYICNTLCDSKAMVRKDISGKEIDNLMHILKGGGNNERERN